MADLVVQRPEGLYCPPGDFYIDPWRPVARAVITHGHSDHARWGSERYLCQRDCAPILRRRLGDIRIEALDYGQRVEMNGVALSLHPAGHVLGSAQAQQRSSLYGELGYSFLEVKESVTGFGLSMNPQALRGVSNAQNEASALQREFTMENPNVSLEQVVIAGEKAKLGFTAAIGVRNRMVQAYSEIMNMQV